MSTAVSQSSSLVTSSVMASMPSEYGVSGDAMSLAKTVAPSLANSSATAWPMPLAAPVTSDHFSLKPHALAPFLVVLLRA